MKKHVLCLLLLAVLAIFPGAAQAEDLELGGNLTFMMGLGFPNMGDLNASLTSAGYPRLSGVIGIWGGGGYGFVGRLMLGGEGFGGIQAGASGGSLSTYAVGGGMFEAGYAVLAKENMALFPYLGIGGAGVRVAAETTDNTGDRIEDYAGGLLLRLGVGGHYRLRFNNDHAKTGTDDLILSVRLGYNVAVGSSWNLHNFPEDPQAGMSGAFIVLTIGGSGFHVPEVMPVWGWRERHHGDTIIIFGD